jgi:hypothetical protein
MNKLAIQTHDFEEAKLAIKKFSEETSQELDFQHVDDKKGLGEWLADALFGGGIGLKHKVTGEELNDLTVQIEAHLCDINTTQLNLIKQFGKVYEALEALDKDYIQGILIAVKENEMTSDRLAEDHKNLKQLQKNQERTLEELWKFKIKLDAYAHLDDVDKIWNDFQVWHAESSKLMDSVATVTDVSNENKAAIETLICTQKAVASKISKISDSLDEQISRIETVIAFMDKLDAIVHLNDVDEMWDSLCNAQADLQKLCSEIAEAQATIAKNAEDISKIQEFIELLSHQEHLNDIDSIWDKTEEHTSQIAALQEQDESIKGIINEHKEVAAKTTSELHKTDERLEKLIQSNKEDADQVVAELHKKNDAQDEQIQSNKAAADQAIAVLEEKNAALSDLVQNNKETVDQEVVDLQAQDAAAMKLIEENKLLAEQALAEANEQTTTMMQQLNKKLMYAYLIAGGSLALAIAELVLILLR